jgi:hypothetical protein
MALVAFGLGSLCLHFARLRALHRPLRLGWKVILLVLALIWISNRALQAPLVLVEYSGIYHFSSIRWANSSLCRRVSGIYMGAWPLISPIFYMLRF